MSKLNPNAQKWVEALRSGKYKQTRAGDLCNDQGHCCLGVLCELAVEQKVVSKRFPEQAFYADFDGSTTYLPLSVQNWAGLCTDKGNFGSTHLAYLNDSGATFSELADMIEQHADELFVQEQA